MCKYVLLPPGVNPIAVKCVISSLNYRSDLFRPLSLLHPVFPPWRPLYRYRRAGRRRGWSSPQEHIDCQNVYARAPEQTISDVRTMLNAAQGRGRGHSHSIALYEFCPTKLSQIIVPQVSNSTLPMVLGEMWWDAASD